MSRDFKIESPFAPAGDQPQAIKELCEGIANGEKNQVLLGVTGSGKTFTMAKIIEQSKRPALIMAPNKILAAQLYSEMKEFFPENHVEYFVSYYDYYQPEAYVPKTDTYIEKDSAINEQIDRMRNAATRNILEDNDVIIVASVSCIYGLGDVESYSQMTIPLKVGDEISPREVHRRLAELQYERNQQNFVRSTFRVQGDILDIFPAHYEDRAWRISFFGDEIESISEFDSLTRQKNRRFERSDRLSGQPLCYAAAGFVSGDCAHKGRTRRTAGRTETPKQTARSSAVGTAYPFRSRNARSDRPL